MNKPIVVIIPAFNEEGGIGNVLAEIPMALVREVIVVDNGSTDATAACAREAGATVLSEPRRGYGSACLRGMAYVAEGAVPPEVVVFLDADHSDFPEELPQVAGPVLEGTADMVIGSRVSGQRERGSLTPQQVFGNWLATRLLHWFYGEKFTDLGPFRAISYPALVGLHMCDTNYGWTVEMQLKAAQQKLRCQEVPVRYRNRIGKSKVSGTVKGTVMAGYKILYTLFKYM
jgi:glycosyltransferase involved in cell wall biosynthesis